MARKLILALLVMLVAQGCISYKFNGASIDYNKYKTVSFANFPIRAALVYPPLQQVFQNKLQDVVTQQTRLQQVDNPNSNLRFEGEITNYSLSPQAVGDNAYATRTRLTISVRVHYIDNINEALSNDINVSAYRDFDANQLLIDVQDQLCEEISAELVDLIFNQTLGNW
ncbi:MAG: LptE family protein [Muribaculaceae bacterium]|nr:LptE family protein [Muribaculaceae bacterium]MBR0023239.1 LptE family protein [Muribaculaceae bacterium]